MKNVINLLRMLKNTLLKTHTALGLMTNILVFGPPKNVSKMGEQKFTYGSRIRIFAGAWGIGVLG